MDQLDSKALGESIRNVFLNIKNYQFDKHVPSFTSDGNFLGDFLIMTIAEPRVDQPPIYYHTFSPYDVISNAAPDYAAVFEGGKLTYSSEISAYIEQRTGIMNSLVINEILSEGINSKRVLFIGAGRMAKAALRGLKTYFPEFDNASFLTASSNAARFVDLAKQLNVEVKQVAIDDIGSYDIIICHSSAKSPILTREMISKIKIGAIITAFASEDHVEIDQSFYDSSRANIIIDWERTIDEAPELNAALSDGIVETTSLILLSELFAKTKQIDPAKAYTIYRSHGTPMQNLGMLKVAM